MNEGKEAEKRGEFLVPEGKEGVYPLLLKPERGLNLFLGHTAEADEDVPEPLALALTPHGTDEAFRLYLGLPLDPA